MGKNATPPAAVAPPLRTVPEQTEIRPEIGTPRIANKLPATACKWAGSASFGSTRFPAVTFETHP